MAMNVVDLPENIVVLGRKSSHDGRNFASGLALGALIGAAIAVYVTQNFDRVLESEQLADTVAAVRKINKHTHKIGDTARYTFRTVKHKVGKGTERST